MLVKVHDHSNLAWGDHLLKVVIDALTQYTLLPGAENPTTDIIHNRNCMLTCMLTWRHSMPDTSIKGAPQEKSNHVCFRSMPVCCLGSETEKGVTPFEAHSTHAHLVSQSSRVQQHRRLF